MNYNCCDSRIEDLRFGPLKLYLLPYEAEDPLNFVFSSSTFATLRDGYREYLGLAAELRAIRKSTRTASFIFPEEPWSRRVSGVFKE